MIRRKEEIGKRKKYYFFFLLNNNKALLKLLPEKLSCFDNKNMLNKNCW